MSTPLDPVTVGIIGCGKIAQIRHIPEYAANPHARLVGFFDSNEARARSQAAPFGGTVFDSWEALLADPAIDAVSVCTSNESHAAIVAAALAAGKHVLAEKPMATTLAECEAIAAAADRATTTLMFDHNQRFTAAHRLARDLYRAGTIGSLVSFRTTFGHGGPETWSIDPGPSTWFFDPARTTTGVIGDLGVHKIDIVHFLTGERIVAVNATLATLEKVDATGHPIPLDDNAIAVCTLSDGALGTVTVSWCYHGTEDNSTVLYGRDGIITIYGDPAHAVVVTRPGVPVERYAVDAMQTNDAPQASSGVIDAFLDAVRSGSPSPVPAAEALAAMRVVFACQEASRTGCRVTIPENDGRTK